MILYVVIYWLKNGFSISKRWYWFFFLFSGFVIFSFVSAFTLPSLFSGMRVYTPKGGIDEQYLAPQVLVPSSSNIGQAFFLLFNWILVLFFIGVKNKSILKVTEKYYFIGALIVCFFSAYQLISILTGIYYPKDIILNTKNFSIFGSDSFGFLPRINSTFVEPSFYAMFMASFLTWAYIHLLKEEKKEKFFGRLFIFLLALLCLIISTSATGFAAMAIFFILHTSITIFGKENRKVKFKVIGLVSAVFASLIILYFAVPGVDIILNSVVFDKGDSDSSLHRFAADEYAFKVLSESNYIGVGLGSNRPSSFFTFLISNIGILGFSLALLAMIFILFYAMRANFRGKASREDLLACEASGWALMVMIIAKFIAGPDLNFPPMWILLFYFITTIRNVQYKNIEH